MIHLAVFGLPEWIPILIIVVLLFGAKKLPELARSMGSSVNEFKKGMAEGEKDTKKSPPDSTPNSNGAPKDH
jgi:sec-independent protein translocase protein TatA